MATWRCSAASRARKTASWIGAYDGAPHRKWGLTPGRSRLPNYITYMFLHVGWLHLLTNMFILYLAGAAVEDVWGRPLFLLFYLAAGILAAMAFAGRYPDFTILGFHPSFAAIIVLFWVVPTLLMGFGFVVVKDRWLSQQRWDDFVRDVHKLNDEDQGGTA